MSEPRSYGVYIQLKNYVAPINNKIMQFQATQIKFEAIFLTESTKQRQKQSNLSPMWDLKIYSKVGKIQRQHNNGTDTHN